MSILHLQSRRRSERQENSEPVHVCFYWACQDQLRRDTCRQAGTNTGSGTEANIRQVKYKEGEGGKTGAMTESR
ncbi:hypothetical protein RRG08_019089 [Elysia crispata]|uniref:Uncharacterized protein n=1 Tax=Elysia crispata TaxID=231223 RepID=A0AAE1A515_9GAST|nr:hypothetical protein RRG08_019089 [Elysia crispata]